MKILKGSLLIVLLFIPILAYSSSPDQETIKKQAQLTREKKLVVNIKYGNGYIDVDKTPSNNVYEGEFIYKKYRPDIQYEIVGNEGRLDIHFSGKLKKDDEYGGTQNISSFDKMYENELNLSLTPRIPMDMDLDLGVIKGNMELGGLKLSDFQMQIGVSTATVMFSQENPILLNRCSLEGGVGKLSVEKLGNANIKNFEFNGGMGSYVLDFSGKYREDMDANIEMGMGKLTLYLPKYIGTHIQVDKSFLSSFSIDDVYKRGDDYYNDQWEKTSRSLNLKLETGVGKVEVIWVDE